MLEKTSVFRHSLSLQSRLLLPQAEVRNLKNTVWKTPFGTLRTTLSTHSQKRNHLELDVILEEKANPASERV